MITLGLDAGTNLGFAVLDIDRFGRGRFIACGKLPEDTDEERAERVDELFLFYPAITLVVVEVPVRLYPGLAGRDPSGKNIIEAMRIGADLIGHLRARGRAVERVTAAEWRKALQCSGSAKTKADAAVAAVLRARCPTWPGSNNHARDAAGAAIFGAMRAQRGA